MNLKGIVRRFTRTATKPSFFPRNAPFGNPQRPFARISSGVVDLILIRAIYFRTVIGQTERNTFRGYLNIFTCNVHVNVVEQVDLINSDLKHTHTHTHVPSSFYCQALFNIVLRSRYLEIRGKLLARLRIKLVAVFKLRHD